MNLNTASKKDLIDYVTKLNSDLTKSQQATQQAIEIANIFGLRLGSIEKIITESPIGKKGFFKTFFWIVNNYKSILALLEQIVTIIKEWRADLDARVAASTPPAPTTPA